MSRFPKVIACPVGTVPVVKAEAGILVRLAPFPDAGVPSIGATNVGPLVRATVVPVPLVVAAIGCELEFDPMTTALEGKASPFIFATLGLGYVPLRSPPAVPLGTPVQNSTPLEFFVQKLDPDLV